MINENKLCNLEQVFEGKKLRLNEDFEEASNSIIARVEYTYEYDKDGVYGRVTYMYDSEGNKIEASEEEYELYLADLARKNGGELPFYYKTQISCELLEKINCLANNDTGLLTYKYHREDSETFKMDYKNYFQYGALVEATKEYEEYLAKLEKRGDFGDWITTAGYGAKAGLALNPATPLDYCRWMLPELDLLLVMTINPGFAGQRMIPQTLDKIRSAKHLLDEFRSSILIEADGNVSFINAEKMRRAGANIFVAGTSSLYAAEGTLEENYQKLRRSIYAGGGVD